MAVAVAVAAKAAAEAAEQRNDQDDDEYRSERHGTPPMGGLRPKRRQSAIGSKVYQRFRCQRRNEKGLFRLKLQRRRIDAVAQSGRAGPIGENVAEMAIALRAQHLGPDHAVAGVTLLVDMALHRRGGEARPAAAGVKLGVGFEQRLAA